MPLNSEWQARRERIDRDIHNGKIQELADQGYTFLQIAHKYEVSETTIRRLAIHNGGPIYWKHARQNKKKSDRDVDPSAHISDAKKLALYSAW